MPVYQKLIFSLLFVILILSFDFLITNAYVVPNGSQSENLATNERKFIQAIYNKYIGGKTLDQLNSTFEPAHQHQVSPENDFSDFYRTMCSQATMTAIAEGDNLSINTPYIKYFASKYNSAEFTKIINSPYKHVRSAPLFDCIVATSALQDYLPYSTKIAMLKDYVSFSKIIYNEIIAGGGMPAYFEARSLNYGDSQAEESTIIASMLLAAANLLPVDNSNSSYLSTTDQSNFINLGSTIAKWAYSACTVNGKCSIQSSTGLVVNHQMDPSPTYTLSLLTSYSEISMIYNQLGLTLPSSIFDSNTTSRLNTIFSNLKNYIAPNFTFKGNFNTVSSSGGITDTFNYENMTYTADSNSELGYSTDADLPVNSSYPVNSIDSMNQYLYTPSNILMSYTYKGDSVWHFRCYLNTGSCKAMYQDSVNSSLKRITNSSTVWGNNLPAKVQASSQWFMPGTTNLKTYFFNGGQVWHYLCNSLNPEGTNTCVAQFVDTLTNYYSNIQNIGNWKNNAGTYVPLPLSDLDAVSQYIIPNTTILKSYVFKGTGMWAYSCSGIGTSSTVCGADYYKDLSTQWSGISGWAQTPPSSNVDAVYQYYDKDNVTLKSYVIAGGMNYAYMCVSGSGCSARFVQKVKDSIGTSMVNQYRWGKPVKTGAIRYTGVSDWGIDATVQNSAFSTMYVIDPSNNLNYYVSLQNEQINARNRFSQTYFPTNYNEGTRTYTFDNFAGTKNEKLMNYLPDGWRQINSTTGIQLAIATDQYIPSNTYVRINTHWWFNVLAGKNHSVAYLTTTNTKILKKITADYSLFDTNLSNTVDMNDVIDLIKYILGSKNPTRLYDYNNSGVSDLVDLIILIKKILS